MTPQSRNNAIDTLLADSLKELAVKKPIEKITIREITDRAGVIRPTFYNHFQDKYELLEWILRNDLIEPMIPFIQRGMYRESIAYALHDMVEEKDFYIQAVHLGGQNSFPEILKKEITELLLMFLPKELEIPSHEWMTPEKLADFYAESISYLITNWAQNGMKIPEKELAETFVYLYSHSIVEIFQSETPGTTE